LIDTPNLIITTTGGNIGSFANNIRTNASDTELDTQGAGDVFVTSSASDLSLNVIDASNLSVIMSNPILGSISLPSLATVSGLSLLSASGAGTISTSAPAGFLSTTTLRMTTQGGDIGSAALSFQTNAGTISADATTAGDVFLESSGTTVTFTGMNRANNYEFVRPSKV
jgi:hypothetical protein